MRLESPAETTLALVTVLKDNPPSAEEAQLDHK